MDELTIRTECAKLYNRLIKFYNDHYDYDMITMVKELFKQANGTAYIKEHSPRYVAYDGRVDTYTIGGSIGENYKDADFTRLIEDLTMAYYRNNGGQVSYTPNVINIIKSY